jgi:hypothetical protein
VVGTPMMTPDVQAIMGKVTGGLQFPLQARRTIA